jgi:hypothetical protein
MGLFDRDYDDDIRSRGFRRGYGSDYLGRPYAGGERYTGAYGGGSGWGGGHDRTFRGYDQTFRGYDQTFRGYDSAYGAGRKSRYETDFGDPFGDRQEHTPIRMIRGGYDRGWFGFGGSRNARDRDDYDRGFRGSGQRRVYGTEGSGRGYDRDHSGNPMGYDPGHRRGRSDFDRYDRGLF